MAPQSLHGKRPTAFTLTELLLVIAIIVIVVALLGPIVGSLTTKVSRRAKCLVNLREIGYATMLYAAEHQNRLVPFRMDPEGEPAGFWYDHLYQYFGRRPGRSGRYVDGVLTPYPGFKCPEIQRRYLINRVAGWEAHGEKGALKWYLKRGQGHVKGKIVELPGGLSGTAYFTCPQEHGDGNFLPGNYAAGNGNFPGFPHGGVCNVLFMDGHIESIPDPGFADNPAQLDQERWVHFFGGPR